MIINGLGLVSAPLYLFSKFFEGKATRHLIGEGIKPEHLNDDRLGRVLDKLYLVGVSQIFAIIANAAANKFEVELQTAHLDSSSFHLHGEYEFDFPSVSVELEKNLADELNNSVINNQRNSTPITITYGYSQGPSPDLKQFILDLVCSGDGDVPVFLRVARVTNQIVPYLPQLFRSLNSS